MIQGNTVGNYRQQADFNEADPTKAGYILNNPIKDGAFVNGLYLIEGVDYGNALPDNLPDGKVFGVLVETEAE